MGNRAWLWALGLTGAAAAYLAFAPQARTATPEDPAAAVERLRRYLASGGSFGTADQPSIEVAKAQRVLQLADDGVVGPATRDAAADYAVMLPGRPRGDDEPATVADSGAAQPIPAEVRVTPREHKGSLVVNANIQLGWAQARLASVTYVQQQFKSNAPAIGREIAACGDAPELKGTPAVVAVDQGSGAYTVQIRWAGTWPSPALPPSLVECINSKARSNRDLRDVLSSLSVARS